MKQRIAAIILSAMILSTLAACGGVDETADVNVTTTSSATGNTSDVQTTTASSAGDESTAGATTTKKSTTITEAESETEEKTTTTKKTASTSDDADESSSGGETTSKAIAKVTTTKAKTTTTKVATTTKKATTNKKVTTTKVKTTTTKPKTTTTKATTTKKVTTTTAAAAKLTQADIDRLVKEMQEYSNEKARPWVETVYEINGYASADAFMADIDWMVPSNSSWDSPNKIYPSVWDYEGAKGVIEGHIDSTYNSISDVHLVVYAEACVNSDGENYWKIYLLR